MYKRSLEGWAKHWDFILIDTLVLQLSFILAYFIRYQSIFTYSSRNAYRTCSFVLLLLGVLTAILFNTMHNVLTRGVWEEVKSTLWQVGIVFAGIVIILYSAKDSDHVSRIVLYLAMILYLVLGFFTRILYKRIFLALTRAKTRRELLLVGDEKGIRIALAAFREHPEEGINVKAVVPVGGDGALSGASDAIRKDESGEKESIAAALSEVSDDIRKDEIAGKDRTIVALSDAPDYIRNEWIDEVYVAVTDATLVPEELITVCSEMAVTVHQQIYMNEGVNDHQWIGKIAKQPVLTTSINIPRPAQLLVKRSADIVAGLILSILALLAIVILGPMIMIASPGPVVLKYVRIGRNGRKFHMYMLRTMYMDAASRAPEDMVIKGVGRLIRSLNLDELPKGFNVLMGQMSLVGTRAPSAEEWEGYQYRHRARLACKPGIAGLWTVMNGLGGAKGLTFEDATKLDTAYITNWSLKLDCKILLRSRSLRREYEQKNREQGK